MRTTVFALSVLLAAGAAGPAAAAHPDRGRLLYENTCLYCHWRSIHLRPRHRIRSLAELEHMIRLWQGQLGLDWGDEEVNDVLAWLNWRYYGFPGPGLVPLP